MSSISLYVTFHVFYDLYITVQRQNYVVLKILFKFHLPLKGTYVVWICSSCFQRSRKLAPEELKLEFRFRRTPPEEGIGAGPEGSRDAFLRFDFEVKFWRPPRGFQEVSKRPRERPRTFQEASKRFQNR